jgi:hypothetical protein
LGHENGESETPNHKGKAVKAAVFGLNDLRKIAEIALLTSDDNAIRIAALRQMREMLSKCGLALTVDPSWLLKVAQAVIKHLEFTAKA